MNLTKMFLLQMESVYSYIRAIRSFETLKKFLSNHEFHCLSDQDVDHLG